MNSLAIYGVAFLGFVGMIWALIRGAKGTGKAEANLDAQKRMDKAVVEESKSTVEIINDAKGIHDRVESDPAYRDRVRERFTRRDDQAPNG